MYLANPKNSSATARIRGLLLAACLLVALPLSAPAWAQPPAPAASARSSAPQPPASSWAPGQYMRRAVRRVVDFANKVIKLYESKNIHLGFLDISPFSGAYLAKGDSVHEGWDMQAGVTYAFLAVGDDRVRTVSLKLYDEASGKLIKEGAIDKEIAGRAALTYEPTKKGRFRVVVTLKDCAGDSGFVGLSILQKGGLKVPVETLNEVSEKCLQMCDIVNGTFKDKNIECRFHNGDNTWAVVGSFIRAGSAVSTDPKPYHKGTLILVGAADSGMSDLNLYLLSDKKDKDGNNLTVAKEYENLKPGPTSWLLHKITPGTYLVDIQNADAQNAYPKPVLAVVASLDLIGDDTEVADNNSKPQPPPKPDDSSTNSNSQTKEIHLSGTWRMSDGDQGGNLDLTFLPGTDMNGRITNKSSNSSVSLKGTWVWNGDTKEAALNFSFSKSTAKGTLTLNDNNHMTGTLNFYNADGEQTGSASVDVEIKQIVKN